MEQKKSIFQAKALERISSPEELDKYLKVTRPSTWAALAAVAVLLVGFVVWGVFGRLTTTAKVAVVSAEGRTVCLISGNVATKVKDAAEVTVANVKYRLVDKDIAPVVLNDSVEDRVLLAGELTRGTVVYVMELDGQLDEGVYVGQLEVESISPISFIMN